MALKIDSSTIHLGGVVPEYFAEYASVAPEEQPPQCALPDEVPLVLHGKPLVPLNLACEFQFPPVIPIPPVYVPPPPRIPEIYPACSTLTATTDIETCFNTRNSHLTLRASGPKTSSPGAPPDCGLTLEGKLCIDLPDPLVGCESFETTTDIKFTGIAGGWVDLTTKDSPECGFSLRGEIHVPPTLMPTVCEEFTASSSLKLSGGLFGSLQVIPSHAPDCGFELKAALGIDACTEFFVENFGTVRGNAVVPGSIIQIFPHDKPNCGVTLLADLEVNACTEISVTSDVRLSGASFYPVRSRYAKIGEMIPDPNNPGAQVPAPVPTTRPSTLDGFKNFNLTNKEDIKAQEGPPPGFSDRKISEAQGSAIVLYTTDTCGIGLAGELNIQACQNFAAYSSLKITGTAVTEKKPITVNYTEEPACSLTLDGELVIDACKETIITPSASGGQITVFSSAGNQIGMIDLAPALKVTKGKDGCSNQISLSLQNATLTLPASSGGSSSGGGGGGGGGGCCCYHCDPTQKCLSSLNVETLEVTSIFSTRYPCCTEPCFYSIDLCKGQANLKEIHASTYFAEDCCKGPGANRSKLDLCGSELYLEEQGGGYIQLSGTCINISNDSVGTTNICNDTATFKNSSGDKVKILGGKIDITGAGGCGSTYISPGGVVYTSPSSTKTDPSDDSQGGEGDEYTSICKDSITARGLVGEVEILNGKITCSNNEQSGSELDKTEINKGVVTVTGMDGTVTSIDGATINQHVEEGGNLKTYIYPGSIESTGESAKMSVDDGAISLIAGGTTIKLDPNGLPTGTYVYFQQIEVCVDGQTKKAWVLMSDPE